MRAALVILSLALASCGDVPESGSAEGFARTCELGGGVYRVGGCSGQFDVCGVGLCQHLIAIGCACDATPDECWDPVLQTCRPEGN